MSKKRLIYAVLVLIFLLLLIVAGYRGVNGNVQTVMTENASRSLESGHTDSDLLLLEKLENSENDGSVSAAELHKNPGEDDSKTESKKMVEPQETDETEKNYEEIVDTIDQLLTYGTSDFYEHYPVDESFFLWLEARYGNATLRNIVRQLKVGKASQNLWYRMTGVSMHVLWLEFCKDYQYQTWRLDNVTWKDAAESGKVTIDFVGDINFDPRWHTMKYAKKQGGITSCISEDILKELKSADITMVNNEFCYTKEKKSQEGKAYSFKANPKKVKLLEEFGTDIVSLANNHTCDYGEQGLLDTMDALTKEGIVYSGAGRNLAEASAVQYFVAGGRKIAFVSATEIERFYHYTKKAGEKTPGVLKTQQKEVVLSAITEARANSDYVIMFVHWGAEGKIKQDSDQRALAQEYAAAGVDAIIGSHPHRLQGVEFVDDVPVVYSLGNFWFSTGTLYATIAQIQINPDGVLKIRLFPCEQKGKKTRLLKKEDECKAFYQYVADLSDGVQINEDGVFDEWDESATFTVPPAYRSGRQYGQHFDNADLELRNIDVVGNLQ